MSSSFSAAARRLLPLLVLLGTPAASTRAADLLAPVADTYVRNSTPATNYGTATTLVSNNANGIRVGFLRFDLSGITRPVTSAKLELAISSASSGQAFSLYALAPSAPAWAETGLTWDNAPGIVAAYTAATGTTADFLLPADLAASGAPLATFTSGPSGTDLAFDVASGPLLDLINTSAGPLTLLVAEPGASDTGGVAWASREAATGQPRLTLSSTPVPPSVTTNLIRVVLVAGQSNADGRASNGGFPTAPINYQAVQDNVPFYYYTYGAATNADGTLGTLTTLRLGASQYGGSGPEIGLGYELSRTFETRHGTKLALIKYAKGGSSLHTDWKANGTASTTGDGPHYLTFQQVVSAGLARLQAAHPAATIHLAGIVWVQGETDIDNDGAISPAPVTAYAANLTRLIADLRATLGTPALPFVFSRISANQTVYSAPADPNYPDYLTLRAQQASTAATVPAAYLIDTDAPAFATNPDHLHFSALGQLALGQAFAARLRSILDLTVSLSLTPPGTLHLAWTGRPLATYTVRSSPDLVAWQQRFTGVATSWDDPTPLAASRRFYRVEEP